MGGVNNLKVVDPTVNTLTVRWDPAVGNVRSYKVTYSAEGDGEQRTVGAAGRNILILLRRRRAWSHVLRSAGGGVRRHHQPDPE